MRNPFVVDILRELNNQKGGVWRDFYKLSAPKDRPQDFQALGYLFYVFQVKRPALLKEATRYGWESSSESDSSGSSQTCNTFRENSSPRCLLISIDDSAERRILLRVQKLSKKLRTSPDSLVRPTSVESCLYQKVFINGKESSSNLYLDDWTTRSLPITCLPT